MKRASQTNEDFGVIDEVCVGGWLVDLVEGRVTLDALMVPLCCRRVMSARRGIIRELWSAEGGKVIRKKSEVYIKMEK